MAARGRCMIKRAMIALIGFAGGFALIALLIVVAG
jgi:hypothetical protein